MGRALTAVAALLVLCFAIFGGVVYFTRDEDQYAVDALLAERLTKAVVEAEQGDGRLDLREVTGFAFDRVLFFAPGTPREQVSQALGFAFKGELRYTAESSEILVFTDRGRFVRFADYRGRRPFVGLERPTHQLDADEAVFEVSAGTVRLAP
jgi:hypothetical protein